MNCKWCLNAFKEEDMNCPHQCKTCFNNGFRTICTCKTDTTTFELEKKEKALQSLRELIDIHVAEKRELMQKGLSLESQFNKLQNDFKLKQIEVDGINSMLMSVRDEYVNLRKLIKDEMDAYEKALVKKYGYTKANNALFARYDTLVTLYHKAKNLVGESD